MPVLPRPPLQLAAVLRQFWFKPCMMPELLSDHSACSALPNAPTPPTIARAMRLAINPYSIAVAADSSFQNVFHIA